MEMPVYRATVTFDAAAFAAALAAYSDQVANADQDGVPHLKANLEVFVDGLSYRGSFEMVACDRYANPISVLLSLTLNSGELSGERFVVATSDSSAGDVVWTAAQLVYRGDTTRETCVTWGKRGRPTLAY